MNSQALIMQLIDAVNAAILANPGVARALKALANSGIELENLHLTADLRTCSPPQEVDDVEFLRSLHIVPDLRI